MNWDAIEITIIGPAMLAGLLVLLTHVPLGIRVLQRGIVFIDLAIAQIAGLGVIGAHALGVSEDGVSMQLAALGAALLGAAVLAWTEKRAGDQQEALIGVCFVLAACASVLLVAGNPHGGEHLKDLLVGQILWINAARLQVLALLTALLLIAMRLRLFDRMGRFGFYAFFAIAVTASVQLVGVYLVFASLIIPALATARLSQHRRQEVAFGIGAAGYLLGLGCSAVFDLPTGAMIAWALAICGLVFNLAAARVSSPR
jgi:zinc/manganese transport system permease protein